MTKIHIFIVDPQVDFMDQPGSALPVAGATADMHRLATMIDRLGSRVDDIFVTLDSHHQMHIANPMMWCNSTGQSPSPFTLITLKDVKQGVWRAKNPAWQEYQTKYVENLEKNNKYQLCIWPPHCIIGSSGYAVEPTLFKSIMKWENENFAMANFITKGSNFKTEHYSGLKAEVVDPSDPTTSINFELIKAVQEADIIAVAGEALSHCVANTVRDLIDNFNTTEISKVHLLTDCSSSVTGFEKMGQDFIAEMTLKGMKVIKSTDFLV